MSKHDILFIESLKEILSSSFPDLQALRILCTNSGYVPNELRGKVWCLLLQDSFFIEDHEVESWNFLQNRCDIENSAELINDVNIISKSYIHLTNLKSDLLSIIGLFCIRRNIRYHSIFCQILLPMLTSSSFPLSRVIASSCFYTLCSNFLPLIFNHPKNYIKNQYIEKIFTSWLRILINYHYPRLGLHLDTVLPSWEQLITPMSPTAEFLGTYI